jgi:superfamily II DNA/RNA helicase
VIVFCNNHFTVDKVVEMLRSEQFHVVGIHSIKSQGFRFRAIKAFKEGQVDILVASDLISRGIDIIDVNNVILYDIPDKIEDYVHRSGRTGRMGRIGFCTSFLTYECKIAKELKKLLKSAKQQIPRELEDSKLFGGDIIRGELGDRPNIRSK